MIKVIVHLRPLSDNVKTLRIHFTADTMSEAIEQVESKFSVEFKQKRILRVEYSLKERVA